MHNQSAIIQVSGLKLQGVQLYYAIQVLGFYLGMQFYLDAVQRNCYQLFPVDWRWRPSLFGHKTDIISSEHVFCPPYFSLLDTHHFLGALRAVGAFPRRPAEDRGEEQNEDDGHFHLVSQRW